MKFTRIIAAAAAIAMSFSAIPTANALTPPYTLPEEVTLFGDVNGDKSVTATDILSFIEFFLSSERSWDGVSPYAELNSDKATGNVWGFNADLDRDKELTVMDLATLKQYIMGSTVSMGSKSFNAKYKASDVCPLLRTEKTYIIGNGGSYSQEAIYVTSEYNDACVRLEELGIKQSAVFDNVNVWDSPYYDETKEQEVIVIVPCDSASIDPDKINEDMSYEQGRDMGELWLKRNGIDLYDNVGDVECVKIFVYKSSAYHAICNIIGFTDNYGEVITYRNETQLYWQIPVPKPVIYLYPEEETEINVKLDFDGKLTHTYPEYPENGWSVTAKPDGTLTDSDGYEYSYLFWDGLAAMDYDMSKGFVVKGEDTASFLREKLSYMGLTPKEYNEFIVYMLPQMESNKYNLIAFQRNAYTDIARLEITPAPDSIQRVFMTFKPLDEYIDVPEQELPTFERKGFTVVEWGGTEVK